MKYTEAQKKAIFKAVGVNPCLSCRMLDKSACCGCPGYRKWEAQFQEAKNLGVLTEAQMFGHAAEVSKQLEVIVQELHRAGLPLGEVREAVDKATKGEWVEPRTSQG